MKQMMKAFKVLMFCMAMITVTATESNAKTDGKFKIKCCFKVGLPSIKFKRPKKDCKSGFGLCLQKAYFCFLCNLDGTMPDCPKCVENQTGKSQIQNYEITGKIDGDQVTLEFPIALKLLPENAEDDFSIFYLDEDFQVFDKETGELRLTLKAGEYSVTQTETSLNVTVSKL